jgi:transposase
MRPGVVERPEYEYLRHGTQCLIANFDVATGEVVAPTVGPSRTEEDFAGHIAHTIATDPEAPWLFIVDQLNIHKSEALVRLVAEACGIKEELGEKEKWGIWQSMPTRAEFLSDVSHRIRFVYTPKHTSWLNQIELWFSILVRRLLKRGNFTSVEDLRERILAFIAYFNKTMAKPFKWTYKGRPLTV